MTPMAPFPLVFEAPRRGQPPRHWADLTPPSAASTSRPPGTGRSGSPAVGALLRGSARRSGRVDRPAGRRPRVAGRAVLPPLLTRSATGLRRRHHGQDPVAAARRRSGGERADALSRPGHHVRVQPGRLRHGLPVLRHRAGGLQRNLSTAEIVEQVMDGARKLDRGLRPGRSGRASATWSSWGWGSRWPTTKRSSARCASWSHRHPMDWD